jgi:hypothetical protein
MTWQANKKGNVECNGTGTKWLNNEEAKNPPPQFGGYM